MVTRANLRIQRETGITPAEIEENRGVLIDSALTEARAAIVEAEDAVAAVEAAGDLATAQSAVTGVATTLGGARDQIDTVLV